VFCGGCGTPDEPAPTVRPRPPHKAAPEQQAAAEQLGRPVVETNSLGMQLVLIPAGTYWRGSSKTDAYRIDDELPQHRVRITRPFYIGVCEVTVGEFRQFVDAQAYRTEAERDGKGGFGWGETAYEPKPEYTWQYVGITQTDEHPVVNVSWNDAMAFCQWLTQKEGATYRLPTEAEWEYACRAGSRTRYSYGYDDAAMEEHAWFEANSSLVTHPVGGKRPNVWGLYDMHGNVFEWCLDCYGTYPGAGLPVDDPVGPDANVYRVYRGGYWYSPAAQCRSAIRQKSQPKNRSGSLGFRVVRQVEAVPAKP
jgi:formylglycine-generating enzyme required for sulfatase activity